MKIVGSERLIVVVGPSGVGKDTLIAGWLASDQPGKPVWRAARRSITRAAQAGGEPHEPLTSSAWEAVHAAGGFALHWRAHGLAYGVRWLELAGLAQGEGRIVNGSRLALPEIRARAPGCKVVHVTADPRTVASRLAQRGREDAEAIAARLQRHADVDADLTIVNDGSPQQAIDKLLGWQLRLQRRSCPG